MKKILIISYTDMSRDPRPLRQIRALKETFSVYTLGLAPSGEEHHFKQLRKVKFQKDILRIPLLKFGLYETYYWDKYKKQAIADYKEDEFDLIIAHEIRLLPLALKIAKGAEVLLDAHEYSPRNFDDSFLWRLFIKKYYTYLCHKYISQINTLFSVSQGIVDEYKKNFGVESILITNACDYEELEVQPIGDKIKIVHHGVAGSSRKLELMIEIMKSTDDRFELYLMLVSTRYTKSYINKLKKLSNGMNNIFFIDPVSKEELIPYCNKFDIGIVFLPPTNFNLENCLPNKFFEMIQSRLAIAIGPDKEMSKYINLHNFGIMSETWKPSSMANALNNLSNIEIEELKNKTHHLASELSCENETIKFLEVINTRI